jgi:hypothetical protein
MNAVIKSKYFQGILIPLILFIVGVLLEYFNNGRGVVLPSWPYNLYLLIGLAFYIVVLYKYLSRTLINYLWSIEFTIGVIAVYAFMILLMGFIKQEDSTSNQILVLSGLSHINRSWELLLVSIYLLIILGLVVLKRLKRMNTYKNIAFFFNHFGIWLVIASASVATGDLIRASVALGEGESSALAKIDDFTLYKLPFYIKLNKFDIETYTPDIIFYDLHTHEILNNPSNDYMVKNGGKYKLGNWTVRIKNFIENAMRDNGNGFIKSDSITNEYAAQIEVTYGKVRKTGWVSSGNYKKPAVSFRLSSDVAITLSLPEERKYLSIIDIYDKTDTLKNVKIEVNKPFSYNGFDIYQSGYNLDFDKKISILEVVRDPWLYVVYIGLIMLVIGAVMLLWTGKIR